VGDLGVRIFQRTSSDEVTYCFGYSLYRVIYLKPHSNSITTEILHVCLEAWGKELMNLLRPVDDTYVFSEYEIQYFFLFG
jgi:hypothetical protein